MDPLQKEQRFQGVKTVLDGPGSPRWKLVALGRFLEALDVTDPFAGAYLLELGERLPGLVERLVPAGLDPAWCARIVGLFEEAAVHHGDLAGVEGFAEAVEGLRRATALGYAWVGDVGAALSVLAPDRAEDPPPWLEPVRDDEDLTPMNRLERAVEQAREQDPAAARALHRLAADWQAGRERGGSTAWVPVVEHDPLVGPDGEYFGGLRRVQVEVYGTRPDADDVTVDVALFGADQGVDGVCMIPVQAARSLLRSLFPAVADQYVVGRVRFGERGVYHTGHSADLAVALLFFEAVLRHVRSRRSYALSPDAALTGRVDTRGTVFPVDDRSLEAKVRAAFFSGATCLAVPRAQFSRAEVLCAILGVTYPRRRLDLVGVGHLRDVLYDRRLTTYREIGRLHHAARWAWRRRFGLGSLGVIAVLLAFIGGLVYGPIDRNPVAYEVQGETLVIENGLGQRLHEISIGALGAYYYTYNVGEADTTELVTFADLTGDAVNEVIWTEWDEAEDRTRAIRCLDLVTEESCWTIRLQFRLHFPRQPPIAEQNYRVQGLLVGDYDRDGRLDLLVLANHGMSFAAVVVRYDALTATERSRYVHMGWLQSMLAYDLDGDGVPSLMLGGTSNALEDDAIMAVLDPRHISGHSPIAGSPQREAYVVEGFGPGREQAYVRLPRTEVGREAVVGETNVKLVDFQLQSEDRQIVARMVDSRFRVGDTFTYGKVKVHFGFDLKPRYVVPMTQYRKMAERPYAEGRITRLPDAAYWQEYLANIQYWNGEGWQAEPYVNWNGISAGGARGAVSGEVEGRSGDPGSGPGQAAGALDNRDEAEDGG